MIRTYQYFTSSRRSINLQSLSQWTDSGASNHVGVFGSNWIHKSHPSGKLVLGGRAAGWLERTVDQWLETRAASQRDSA